MKTRISTDQWEQIEKDADSANYLLNDLRFAFFINYLKQSRDEIAQIILTNRIRSVDEHVKISDTLRKVFHLPKKVQIDELIGQYKHITQELNFLEYTANLKKQLEDQEARKQITIDRSKEK